MIERQDPDLLWSQVKKWVMDASSEFPMEIRIPRECFFIEEGVVYLPTPEEGDRKSCIRTVPPPPFVEGPCN